MTESTKQWHECNGIKCSISAASSMLNIFFWGESGNTIFKVVFGILVGISRQFGFTREKKTCEYIDHLLKKSSQFEGEKVKKRRIKEKKCVI